MALGEVSEHCWLFRLVERLWIGDIKKQMFSSGINSWKIPNLLLIKNSHIHLPTWLIFFSNLTPISCFVCAILNWFFGREVQVCYNVFLIKTLRKNASFLAEFMSDKWFISRTLERKFSSDFFTMTWTSDFLVTFANKAKSNKIVERLQTTLCYDFVYLHLLNKSPEKQSRYPHSFSKIGERVKGFTLIRKAS